MGTSLSAPLSLHSMPTSLLPFLPWAATPPDPPSLETTREEEVGVLEDPLDLSLDSGPLVIPDPPRRRSRGSIGGESSHGTTVSLPPLDPYPPKCCFLPPPPDPTNYLVSPLTKPFPYSSPWFGDSDKGFFPSPILVATNPYGNHDSPPSSQNSART